MPSARALRTALAGGALVAVCATGVGSLASSALYSDTGSEQVAITAGTVTLGTGKSSDWVVSPPSGLVQNSAVFGTVRVSNDGSLGLRYAIRSTTSNNAFGALLTLTVKSGVSACTAAGFDASGVAAGPTTAFGSTSGTNVVGDPSAGSQTGDRTLGAGQSETLCIRVALPRGVGRDGQAASSTSTTFTFTAENV